MRKIYFNINLLIYRYQFYQLPPELNMQCIDGEIDANDTLTQECTFFPTTPDINYDFEVQCILNFIKNGITVGSKCCVILRVRGSSKIGSLKVKYVQDNFFYII